MAKSIDQKGGNRSDDSTTKLAGPSKMSVEADPECFIQEQKMSVVAVLECFIQELKMSELPLVYYEFISECFQFLLSLMSLLQKSGKSSDDSTTELAGRSKLIKQKGGKGSDDSSAEYESKELSGVLLHTGRLTVCDKHSYTPIRLGREDEVNVKPINGKKMCCRPFKEKNLALRKKPVILRAHLYEDLIMNSDLVKRQEEEQEFVPAHPEQPFVIKAAEGDLKMTCYVKETVIGGPFVVPIDKLMSGARICQPFELDFTNQPDIVAMSLSVGQTERLEDKLLFPLDFSTPHRRERASPQVQEQLQGASSSSQTTQTSHHTTDETLENISGRQEDFEEKLNTVARKVAGRIEIDNLGKGLGFAPEDIKHYVDGNTNTRYMGTLSMIRDWRKKQTKATERKVLKGALEKAGQNHLADELFGTA